MGILRDVRADRSCTLEPEHLIGRGPQCSLRLSPNYVSAQHAVIRWNGQAWDLLDRGSRNGTWLNGELIEPRRVYLVGPGSVVAFGHPDEKWEVCNDDGPRVSVVPVDGGEALFAVHAMIGIPSIDDPRGAVYRDSEGRWRLEYADGEEVAIRNGATFPVAGCLWRFCCPESLESTAIAEPIRESARTLAHLAVSSDEEYVELSLQYADRTISLGSRSHNYLLLLLARARLADRGNQVAESSAGWVHKEELATSLRVTPQQVDGEVFRIRKHFAQCGAEESATVIERRSRTQQLRIGIADVRITKL